jgi:GDPmannose 4,6-dehydratase
LRTAIIFGVNGQDGFYLKSHLEQIGYSVTGISRSVKGYVTGDVSDFSFVQNQIKSLQPELVFHLAAKSTTWHEDIFENHTTISTGTLNILESVYKHSPQTKVFITGSGVQFKNISSEIKETDDFEALSGYSVARIQSVYAARYYRSLGVSAYVGYLFHHESPLRRENHINQRIVQAAKRIANGSAEKLRVGDVSVVKEFGYAKDIVAGMVTLLSQNTVFEACIGTGKGHSIEEWLTCCFGHFNLDWRSCVEVTPHFKPEYSRLVSNPTTINQLGWKATTDIQSLAQIMLESNA